jgi:peptidoglycan/LPS O-acetylase OafA/YrhL
MIGVTLFFVLSGFLITRILLASRDKAEQTGTSRLHVFRQFFLRRALRIFPIYYITLAVLCLSPLTPAVFKSQVGYHFGYLSNVLFFRQGREDFAAHLWTLSVEEQFYLLWPFVILFVPRRSLSTAIGGFLALGAFFRLFGGTDWGWAVLTPSCFDSFALGAALALARVGSPHASRPFMTALRLLAVASAALCIVSAAAPWPIWRGGDRTLLGVLSAWVIAEACRGIPGVVGRLLRHPVLLYLGKISYGLYLFHEFLRHSYENLHRLCLAADIRVPVIGMLLVPHGGNGAMFPFYFVIVVGLASGSWFVIEKPINQLRQRLEYTR